MTQKTPFYDHHISLGAKMVDFAGWEMPIQYTSIKDEHLNVRENAGIFDISHMGQLFIWGEEAEAFVQFLLTNDISKCAPNTGLYAHMLNTQGGVIDDLFVYRVEPQKFLLILNASRKETDLKWIRKQARSFEVEMMEAPMAAGLALQGPKSAEILKALNDKAPALPKRGIAEFNFGDVTSLVARTGYTGEDGFELFAPAGHLLPLWDMIFHAGKNYSLKPAGLGARDTLRTEMGYPLFGHELNETHTPFEAGLNWVVKMEKEDFIGKEALEDQLKNGPPTKLVGFKVVQGGIARPGAKILREGTEEGMVTSGTFSPSLNAAIGMGFVKADTPLENTPLLIRQGEREMEVAVTPLPFIPKKSP